MSSNERNFWRFRKSINHSVFNYGETITDVGRRKSAFDLTLGTAAGKKLYIVYIARFTKIMMKKVDIAP